MSIKVLSGKVFLVVTGASRGIGRQIAITFGSLLQEGSRILLLARNLTAMEEIAKKIPSKVTVNVVSMDLSKVTESDLKEAIAKSLKGTTCESFDRMIVVHNVGSLGPIDTLDQLTNVNDWRVYYDLNLFVPAMLNVVVMNFFNDKTNTKKLIINISSLLAISAMVGGGYYCSVKAAREMYFKVFALENPDVNVLNYSPGPVDTEMFDQLCRKITMPADKQKYHGLREKNMVLTTEQTVNRLLEILKAQKYKPADHVDYYEPL